VNIQMQQTDYQVPLFVAQEHLCWMLLATNQNGEALKCFQDSLQQFPRRYNSIYGCASAANKLQNTILALSYYQTLIDLCSENNTGTQNCQSRASFSAAQDYITLNKQLPAEPTVSFPVFVGSVVGVAVVVVILSVVVYFCTGRDSKLKYLSIRSDGDEDDSKQYFSR